MSFLALAGTVIAWICVVLSLLLLMIYAVRHHLVALTRFRQAPQKDAGEIAGYYTPRVTILIPMHNEERVAADRHAL